MRHWRYTVAIVAAAGTFGVGRLASAGELPLAAQAQAEPMSPEGEAMSPETEELPEAGRQRPMITPDGTPTPVPGTTVEVNPPAGSTVVVTPNERAPEAPPPTTEEEQKERRTWVSFSPNQMALTVGGGYADFAFQTMRDQSRPGAGWDARLLFGTRSPIAFELGYSGTYNTFTPSADAVAKPYLVSNGFDGALRINFLPWRVQPYVFGGVGYNHMQIYNRGEDLSVVTRFNQSDSQLLVPAGGGLSFYFFRHATLDARATYRAIFNNDIIAVNPDARADQYMVVGRFGYSF